MVRRVAILLVAGLVASAGTHTAWADDKVRHEGKTLAEWSDQVFSKSEERSDAAMLALGRARFLVDAPATALPALQPFLDARASYPVLTAVGDYGPLAQGLDGELSKLEDTIGTIAICRVRILRDAREPLAALEKRLQEAKLAAAKKPLDLGMEFQRTGNLGLRAQSTALFLRDCLRSKDRAVFGQAVAVVGETAMDWGECAAPFSGFFAQMLSDKEPVIRGRGTAALAWMRNLTKEQDVSLFKTVKALPSGPFSLRITKGVAVTMEHEREATIAFLRGRTSNGDPAVASWASAGLARRVEGEERAKILVTLKAMLKNANHEARAGAADGILALTDIAEPILADLQPSLADADLRVRWRVAAVLIGHDQAVDQALPEMLRGIDSPDDQDRMAAFAALTVLGQKASPLAERIEPWTTVPFPLIAEQASRAYEAMKPK